MNDELNIIRKKIAKRNRITGFILIFAGIILLLLGYKTNNYIELVEGLALGTAGLGLVGISFITRTY